MDGEGPEEYRVDLDRIRRIRREYKVREETPLERAWFYTKVTLLPVIIAVTFVIGIFADILSVLDFFRK